MCPRQRLPAAERKKEIRTAAKEVFLEKGFSNTTMEDVINKVGMSKGGVYRHYSSTSDMLYDLMEDGNHIRYHMIDEFLNNNKNISIDELSVETVVMKMLDEVDYKSLYAMFLIETKKNSRLKELKYRIMEDGKKNFLEFLDKRNLTDLSCLVNEEFMEFINAIIVSAEIVDVRERFLKHKDFFRDIVRQYIKKNR